jgi:hypothetical protein
MRDYGRATVHEFLRDLIVYRNLVPLDERLPPLARVSTLLGLPAGLVPRKSEREYARVIVHLLREARALDAPGITIRRLAYVGDTRLNDGTAFSNICRAGNWPGLAFIGSEVGEPRKVEVVREPHGSLYVANRWSALSGFVEFCGEQGFQFDESTAVIVDLDKTALGARGRNDRVIDRARVEAVRRTVGSLLGDGFDPGAFQTAYDRLNQPQFHPFTTDNQDYLAYMCLVLGSGLLGLDSVVGDVRSGRLVYFGDFIAEVESRRSELPASLQDIHGSILDYVRMGDPTPFKAFRYSEYRATVERMGTIGVGTLPAQLLERKIVITQEVRKLALGWRERGALLFGLSDKPDEASIPQPDLAAEGYLPIHRVETHSVGE